jgi:Spy/CpxP family protein refolding chaperone
MPRNKMGGGWAALALAPCLALACSREPKPEQSSPQPPEASASVARFAGTAPKPGASAEPPHRRMRGHGHGRGPAGPLLSQTRKLELSPQQESAVSVIEADLRAAKDPWRLHGELAKAVATEVRAGEIDRKKLEPQLKLARDEATQERARQVKALNSLHATLDEAQRRALVLAVRNRQDWGSNHSAFSAKGKEAPNGPSARRAKRELERLSADLGLDPEQRTKAEKLVAANPTLGEISRTGREAPADLLDAFDKTTFDATKLKLDQGGEEAFNQRLEYLDKLSRILTPEQRGKLADSLTDRRGSEHHRRTPPAMESEDEAPPGAPQKP